MGFKIKEYDLDLILSVYDQYYSTYFRYPKYEESFNGIPIGKLYNRLYRIIKSGKKQDDGSILCGKIHLDSQEYEKIINRSIGMTKKIYSWEEYFEIFKKFYEKYGSYPRSYETYENVNIGNWVITQRMIYNNGELQDDSSYVYKTSRLTKEHIDILNDYGFAWSNFDMYLNLLKDYIKEYGDYPKYNAIYKGENLGTWIFRNRLTRKLGEQQEDGSYLYNSNRLTLKDIEKLDSINFIWEPDKKELVFDHNYEILKEYYEKGLDYEKYKGLNIKTWSSQLRTTFNRGEEKSDGVYQYSHNSVLTFDSAKKLDKIGFGFVTSNRYYKEQINSTDDMNKKKRYLLLKLERLLNEEKKFMSKQDVEKINEEFIKLVYKK